jgi:hypothetical protein
MPAKKATASTTATPPKKNKKSGDEGDKEQAAPKKAPSLKDIRALAKEKPAAAPKRKHPIPEDESEEFGVDEDGAVKEDSNSTDTDDETKAEKAKDKKPKSSATNKKKDAEEEDEEKSAAKKKAKPAAAAAKKKKQEDETDEEEDEKPAKKKSKTEDGKAKPAPKSSTASKPVVKKPKKATKEDDDAEAVDADSTGKADNDDSEKPGPSAVYCQAYSDYFAECLARFAKGPKKVMKLFPFGVITFISKGEKHVLRVLFDPENPKRGFVGFVDFLSGFLLKGVDGASVAEVKLLQETPAVYGEHVVSALAPNGYGEFAMNTFLSLESALLFGLTPGSKIRRKQFAQEVWDALAGAAWAVQLYDSNGDNDKLLEKYKVVACAHILGDGALVASAIKSGESAKEYVDGLPYSVSNAFRAERKLSEKPASKSTTDDKKKPAEKKQPDAKTSSAPKKVAEAPKPDEKKKAIAVDSTKPPLGKARTVGGLASVKEEGSKSSSAPDVKSKAVKTMNASNSVASSPVKPASLPAKPKPAASSNGHDSTNDEMKTTEAAVPAEPIVEDRTPVVADAPTEPVAADGGEMDIPCADGDAEITNGEPAKENGECVAADNAPEMAEVTDDNASQV